MPSCTIRNLFLPLPLSAWLHGFHEKRIRFPYSAIGRVQVVLFETRECGWYRPGIGDVRYNRHHAKRERVRTCRTSIGGPSADRLNRPSQKARRESFPAMTATAMAANLFRASFKADIARKDPTFEKNPRPPSAFFQMFAASLPILEAMKFRSSPSAVRRLRVMSPPGLLRVIWSISSRTIHSTHGCPAPVVPGSFELFEIQPDDLFKIRHHDPGHTGRLQYSRCFS